MKSELDFFLYEFKYIDINSFIGTLELDKKKEQHIGSLTQFIADKIDNIITKNDHLLKKFTNIITLDIIPDQSPTDQSPTDQSPTDQSPTDQSPTDQSPTDQSPTDQSPTDQSPTDQSPTDQSPTDQSPTESTSEKITHLVAKAAYNYFYDNQEFKDLVNEYINLDSEDNCEPDNRCIDKISEYLKEFTNKLIGHLAEFDKKKLTIKVIDGSCTINNYNLDDIKKIQDISKQLDILFEKKQNLPEDQKKIFMNQIIEFFKQNKDNLEYIENYVTKDFAFKSHLLNLRDMYKAGVNINTKSPLPDSPGDSVSHPSTQTTTLSL